MEKKSIYLLSEKDEKNERDKSFLSLHKSPVIIASGILTIILPEDPNELCDTLNLLIQEKQAGRNSDIINEEIAAIVDRFLEYKCITAKQRKFLVLKCLN